MPYVFLPNKPTITIDPDDYVWKDWFQNLWRYSRGENGVAPLQKATFTMNPDYYMWPVDTTAGIMNCVIPLAAQATPGKKYAVSHAFGAPALTIVLSGADVGYAGGLAINNTLVMISDGVSTWYKVGLS